jgi:hypothetical protein
MRASPGNRGKSPVHSWHRYRDWSLNWVTRMRVNYRADVLPMCCQ